VEGYFEDDGVRVLYREGSFFSSLATISFSRKTFYGVSWLDGWLIMDIGSDFTSPLYGIM
jgi:hypothetical protein